MELNIRIINYQREAKFIAVIGKKKEKKTRENLQVH